MMELVPWASSSYAKCCSYRALPHVRFASLCWGCDVLEMLKLHPRPKGCWEKANSLFGPSADWAPWRWHGSLGNGPPGKVVSKESTWGTPPPSTSTSISQSACPSPRGADPAVLSFPVQDPQPHQLACLWEGMDICWARNFTILISCNPHSKPAGGYPEVSVDQLQDPEQTSQSPMPPFSHLWALGKYPYSVNLFCRERCWSTVGREVLCPRPYN